MLIRIRVWIPDYFSFTSPLRNRGFLEICWHLSLADFYDTWRNDSHRQENEFTTFRTDPADIRVRIWINPEIRIRIPGHIFAFAGVGKEWPSRSDFWWWSRSTCGFRTTFFIFFHYCGIGDLRRFISVFHTITGRFLRYLAKQLTPTREWIHNILGPIRQTSGSVSGLIRTSGFDYGITFWAWQSLRSLSGLVKII